MLVRNRRELPGFIRPRASALAGDGWGFRIIALRHGNTVRLLVPQWTRLVGRARRHYGGRYTRCSIPGDALLLFVRTKRWSRSCSTSWASGSVLTRTRR
jgi:hypothetical protein